MKVLRETGGRRNPYAAALARVEDCMRKNGVRLDYLGGVLFVTIKDRDFRLVDVENLSDHPTGFPRAFDSERLEPEPQ